MTSFELDVGFVKSPGCLNTTGDKIQIELDFHSSDKATVIVFGNHNGQQFLTMMTVYRGSTSTNFINNIVGSLGVASITPQSNNNLIIRCNTTKYGTCTVIANVPIVNVIFTN